MMREWPKMMALTGTPLHREIVLAWRTDSALAPLVDELCEQIGRGYLGLVEGAPFYRRWWDGGGAGFAARTRCPE